MISVLIWGLLATGYQLQEGVTPVQKVIQLMQDMTAKGKAEKDAEQVTMATYVQFCKDTTKNKQRAIKEAGEDIDALNAEIEKAGADQERLAGEIAQLQENIATWSDEKNAQQKERDEEHKTFSALHADYSESLDAIDRAVAVLGKQDKDTAQLIQTKAAVQRVASLGRVPLAAKRALEAFLQTGQEADPMAVTAPEANAYEFQSGGVIDMLKKMGTKLEGEKRQLEAEEAEAKHAFQMAVQGLVGQIEEATTESDVKTKRKAQRKGDEASATGELTDTTKTKKEDTAYLAELVAECDTKSREFESRQMLRAEELEAIAKAIGIIASGAVSGNSEKHLPQLLQSASFVQLRAGSGQNRKLQQALSFLEGRAKATKSTALNALVARAAADPFKKVKKMIQDMIVKLMEEANAEAEHKGWCDTELATNKQTREMKSTAVSELTAQSEKLTAEIDHLASSIAELTAAIQAIDDAVSEASAIRTEENAKNTETVADAREAQEAVGRALEVLRAFYEKASKATALAQGVAGAPESFDKPYQGMGGSSTGVVGMLEVIESDFARLEADTSSNEQEAADAHQKFLDESDTDKAVKQMDLQNRQRSKTDAEAALQETKEELQGTQDELDAALAYYEKLKPDCVDAGLSYEDRVAAREEEIESLQNALKILGGEDI